MTDDARPLLVFFATEHSGPARRMESLLAHLARKERARLRVTRVDIDARPDLAERFRVREVPTLVLVKGKRAVARIDGRTSAPRIERMLEPYLAARARGGVRARPARDGPARSSPEPKAEEGRRLEREGRARGPALSLSPTAGGSLEIAADLAARESPGPVFVGATPSFVCTLT